MTGLVKSIDTATVELKSAKAGSFVVMLSEDDKLEGQLKKLDENEKFKKTVLTIDNPTGPKGFEIAKDAEVTVVLYTKRKCVKTFAFPTGKLTDKDSAAIVAEFKTMAQKKDEKMVKD